MHSAQGEKEIIRQNLKITSIVGTRPQLIKLAIVSKELEKRKVEHSIIHTEQHYDYNLSDMFFEDLDLPRTSVNLGVGSGTHGYQTGLMLYRIESALEDVKPDIVIVYGDCNSTLAGALAATKLKIPVAHVEAGLRCHNKTMPEEINRIVVDAVSNYHFCPSNSAIEKLMYEGILAHDTGDVMYDSFLMAKKSLPQKPMFKLDNYILVTIHRAENTEDEEIFKKILGAIIILSEKHPIIFPIHPRTQRLLTSNPLLNFIVDPIGYKEMLALEKNAKVIVTDSGGVQKEAFWFGVPCVTLRNETEWIETVKMGGNILADPKCDDIVERVLSRIGKTFKNTPNPYGDGNAGKKIVNILLK